MATYILIHGAATDAWYWKLLTDELRARAHSVVAPDLPCHDPNAGLATYTDTVVDAVGNRSDLVVVAHSFGGFIGPLVCARVPVDMLVMLHAQIPSPGETPADWWNATGYSAARAMQDELDHKAGRPTAADDPIAFALHDTPPDRAAKMAKHQRKQADTPFGEPWPLTAWPSVTTRVLLARDDRFLPVEFMSRLTQDRLGITPDVMPGDHCPMLGHPRELANRLESYRAQARAAN